MFIFLQYLIDFIFPPTVEELNLRELPNEKLHSILKPADSTEYPFIKSIFSYKDKMVKELIWQIKYKKNRKVIEFAGLILFKELMKEKKLNDKFNNKVLLIPIPISKQRRKERGYNQCELLINEIIKLDSNNMFNYDYDLLIRIKNIEKQTYKDRKDRLTNIENIFNVNKILDFNQKIILIDDVTTTGSTLNEARNCLIKSGYNNITALALAH